MFITFQLLMTGGYPIGDCIIGMIPVNNQLI